MYQRFIKLDNSSYIEIATRLIDSTEKVVVALRGSNDASSPAIVSIFLDPKEMDFVLTALQEAKDKINGV